MEDECKRSVYVLSNILFTTGLNKTFTVPGVAVDRKAVAQYVAKLAEKKGWKQADFARRLLKSDSEGARQRVSNWMRRGLPADQDAAVAALFGITIEQLLSAGEKESPEPPLPEEAAEFARQWLQLDPLERNNIKQTVLMFLGKGRSEGHESRDEQPPLQRSRRR